jgi:hypothetical protein
MDDARFITVLMRSRAFPQSNAWRKKRLRHQSEKSERPEGEGAAAVFGANLSRPTGSFGQRQKKSETGQIMCYEKRTF